MSFLTAISKQWRRQRSKEARSFRGQKILQPGHPDALFSSKKVEDIFLKIFCSYCYRNKAIRRARQGGARAVDLPARSFDPARPGVAPPLSRRVVSILYWEGVTAEPGLSERFGQQFVDSR